MDPEESRAHLLDVLRGVLRQGGATRLLYAESGLPPVAGGCFHPRCRMNLILSGETPVVHTQAQQVVTTRMRAGEMLFCPPFGWNRHDYPAAYALFGLVFREECTRFIWSGHKHRERSTGGPDVWFHVERPLPAPARQVLESLRELAEQRRDVEAARLLANALLHLLEAELLADISGAANKARQTYQHARAYIQENHHLPINRETIAGALRLHPNYLSRLFRAQSGETLVAYLQRLRLERAVALLADLGLTIGEVAAGSGFGDLGHFFRVFRHVHGMSPGAYRQSRCQESRGGIAGL